MGREWVFAILSPDVYSKLIDGYIMMILLVKMVSGVPNSDINPSSGIIPLVEEHRSIAP